MSLGDPQYTTGPVAEIRAGAESARGLREENQDAMTRFLSRFGEVILVADGMGGHQGGATASDMVAKRFRMHLESMPPEMTLPEALQHATIRINDEIFERGHSGDASIAGMGSTLVLAVLTERPTGWEVTVANAGDSRAYLVRDGVLRQLTKDHTAVQRMIDAGLLTEENARHHPNASVLTRALGQQQGTTCEVYPPVSLQLGDGLLLCSDGLAGYVVDSEIARVIAASPDPNSTVRSLVETALKSGSDDNITVQFLRLGDRVAAPSPVGAAPMSAAPASIAAAPVGAVPSGYPPPPMAAAPPPPAAARRTGRLIAIIVVLVAAALAWPVATMVKGWFQGGGNKSTKGTQTITSTGTQKQKSSGGKTIGGGVGQSNDPTNDTSRIPPSTSPAGTPPAIPPAIPPQAPGGSQNPKPSANVDVHVPDPAKKPEWVDVLKKKLPNLQIGPVDKIFISQLAPKSGIKIVFRPGFQSDADSIEGAIRAIAELNTMSVERVASDILPVTIDIMIVGAPEVYKTRFNPTR